MMIRWLIQLSLVAAACFSESNNTVQAFLSTPSNFCNTQPGSSSISNSPFSSSTTTSTSTTSCLYAAPPQRRQARRDLKKRRRKNRKGVSYTPASAANPKDSKAAAAADDDDDKLFWETSEIRPLISSNAVEAGEDYWMDPVEYQRAVEREQALLRNQPGQIPKEKLWTEVLSPYKQNWIGLISVTIVVLVFIIQKFPELTNYPSIPIPDL